MNKESEKNSILIEKLEEFGIFYYQKKKRIVDFELVELADVIALNFRKISNDETINFDNYNQIIQQVIHELSNSKNYKEFLNICEKIKIISEVLFSEKFASQIFDLLLEERGST